MKLSNRNTLKSFFKRGSRPTEENFEDLINSTVNKVDDGISKDMEHGLMLSPEGTEHKRLLSFFTSVQNERPDWSVELNPKGSPPGLDFSEPDASGTNHSRLFLAQGGHVGVGTREPGFPLEVSGFAGMKGRWGTFAQGSVAADGKWHTVIEGLSDCQAFEVVAQAGRKKEGKYALLHAIALSTFGRSHSKIRKTQAHFGPWWNKIAIRWTGSTFNYNLQLRTRCNYGSGSKLNFHVTRLWETPEVNEESTPPPAGQSAAE